MRLFAVRVGAFPVLSSGPLRPFLRPLPRRGERRRRKVQQFSAWLSAYHAAKSAARWGFFLSRRGGRRPDRKRAEEGQTLLILSLCKRLLCARFCRAVRAFPPLRKRQGAGYRRRGRRRENLSTLTTPKRTPWPPLRAGLEGGPGVRSSLRRLLFGPVLHTHISYLILVRYELAPTMRGRKRRGGRAGPGLLPDFGQMMGAGLEEEGGRSKCRVTSGVCIFHGVSKKRQTVGMNWKRAGWGAVAGVGGGNMYFGLTEDLPLFTVLGMACLLFSLFKLRALNRE